jgi:hypothetical protein
MYMPAEHTNFYATLPALLSWNYRRMWRYRPRLR